MRIQSDSVLFAYDCSRIESAAGVRRLIDYGPYGLHAVFPGGASDPVPQLDGSLLFASAGGPDYLSLPLTYYNVAPTGAHTWLGVYRASIAGATEVLFSTWSTLAGLNYGTTFIGRSTIPEMRNYQNQGGAGAPYVRLNPLPAQYDKKIIAITTETTPRSLKNEQTVGPPAWVGGAFGVCAYDVTKAPRIGAEPALWSGDFYLWYLCQLRGAVASSDLAELSAPMAAGRFPFCWRQP